VEDVVDVHVWVEVVEDDDVLEEVVEDDVVVVEDDGLLEEVVEDDVVVVEDDGVLVLVLVTSPDEVTVSDIVFLGSTLQSFISSTCFWPHEDTVMVTS